MKSARPGMLAAVALGHVLITWAVWRGSPPEPQTVADASMVWVRLTPHRPPPSMNPKGPAQPTTTAPRSHRPAQALRSAVQIAAAATPQPLVQPLPDDGGHTPPAHAVMPAPEAVLLPAPALPMPALPPPPAAPKLQPAEHAHCPRAPHPAVLRDQGIEGDVRLRVQVSASGRPGDVQVLGGSGWRLFDEAAVANALRCVFVPAQRDGQAVDSWVEFAVRFALVDAAGAPP
jgi:periplasmic protein TonB